MTARSHWDELYATTPVDQTGWHEPEPVVSLSLIEKCNLQRDDLIVDVGARASSLVDQLIDLGFQRLVTNVHLSKTCANDPAWRGSLFRLS